MYISLMGLQSVQPALVAKAPPLPHSLTPPSPLRTHPVSRHVRKRGSWEAGLLGQLMEAMDRASAFHGGLPRHQLAMLDVGANVGVHTAWMQAAGYKVRAREAGAWS